MTLSEMFPNATARPWTLEEQRIGKWLLDSKRGPIADFKRWIFRSDGKIDPAVAAEESANLELVHHAVNTYDARDEALREARALIGEVAQHGSGGSHGEFAAAFAKIESALAEGKPRPHRLDIKKQPLDVDGKREYGGNL